MTQSEVARGYLRDLAARMATVEMRGRTLSGADLLEAADRLRDIEERWDELLEAPQTTVCCCSHSLPEHEPDGKCQGCYCTEFVGAGSREAMTMLALRGALKDAKIVRVEMEPK